MLVSDENAAEAAAYLTRCEFVGLDTENVAFFETGRPNRPVSKVQTCGRARDAGDEAMPRVFIWPLDRLGDAAKSLLKAFLTDSKIKKVGISVAHDVAELAKVDMALNGAVNVKDELKSFFAPPSWTCEEMIDFCLGAIIDKNIDHRNWEHWPLTERQIECESYPYRCSDYGYAVVVTLPFLCDTSSYAIPRYMASDAFAPFVLYELAQFRKTGAGRSPRAIYIIDDDRAGVRTASPAGGHGSTTTAAGRRAAAGATAGVSGSDARGGARAADNADAAGGASTGNDDADGAAASGGASVTNDADGSDARATDGDGDDDGARGARGAAASGATSATNDDRDDEAMAHGDREEAGGAAGSGGERGSAFGGITMMLRSFPDSPPIVAVVDEVAPVEGDAEPDDAAACDDASPFAPIEGEARRVLDSLFEQSAREIRRYAISERSDELHLPPQLTRRVPCLTYLFALGVLESPPSKRARHSPPPPSVLSAQREKLHILAGALGLAHRSMSNNGDLDRHLVVAAWTPFRLARAMEGDLLWGALVMKEDAKRGGNLRGYVSMYDQASERWTATWCEHVDVAGSTTTKIDDEPPTQLNIAAVNVAMKLRRVHALVIMWSSAHLAPSGATLTPKLDCILDYMSASQTHHGTRQREEEQEGSCNVHAAWRNHRGRGRDAHRRHQARVGKRLGEVRPASLARQPLAHRGQQALRDDAVHRDDVQRRALQDDRGRV